MPAILRSTIRRRMRRRMVVFLWRKIAPVSVRRNARMRSSDGSVGASSRVASRIAGCLPIAASSSPIRSGGNTKSAKPDWMADRGISGKRALDSS